MAVSLYGDKLSTPLWLEQASSQIYCRTNYGTASPFSSQAQATATIESSSNGRHKQRSSWLLTLASLPQALLRLCRLVPSGRLHARFSTRLVRGSPYTRSKYRSNHRLYRDTMPLKFYHYCLQMWSQKPSAAVSDVIAFKIFLEEHARIVYVRMLPSITISPH